MKKILYVLFIFLSLPAISNASQFTEDPEIYRQKYSRNYSFACTEFACGSALFLASYAVPNEDLQHYLVVAGIGLIVDATCRIGQNVIEAYFENLVSDDIRRSLRRRGQRSQARFNELQIERVPPMIDKVRCRLGQAKHFLNLTLNLVTLYQLSSGKADDSINFTDAGYYVTLAVCSASAFSNSYEMYYSYKTGYSRSDRPLIQIGSGICEQISAAIYRTNNLSLQVLGTQGNTVYAWWALTPPQRAFYRSLQTHGDYQAFMGLFQTAWHAYSYFRQPLIEEMLEKPSEPRPEPTQRIKRRLTQLPEIQSLQQPAQQEMVTQQPLIVERPESISAVVRPEKKKTRGVAGNPDDFEPRCRALAEHPTVNAEDQLRDETRRAALFRLDLLSGQSTVSVQEMDHEINMLLRFLPNAQRVDAGHNKDAIVLNFANGSRFRTTFETPHHQKAAGSNEYKKARKERALDSLRICYLLGWDEARIRDYLAQNNRGSFYNLPAFLVHILWSRGRL